MRVFVINSEFMGRGDDDLGRRLTGAFLRTICSEPDKPDRILFYNSGVRLLVESSPVSDAVEALVSSGVELVACGTCVHHFGLEERIDPDLVGDMKTMVSNMMKADVVVTI